MRTEKLARDLAVATATGAVVVGTSAAPAAGGEVCREEGHVVTWCVVRGQVCAEE